MTDSEIKNLWKLAEAAAPNDPASLIALADALRERGGRDDEKIAYALEWMADWERRPRKHYTGESQLRSFRSWSSGYFLDTARKQMPKSKPCQLPALLRNWMNHGGGYSFKSAVLDLATALRKLRESSLLKRHLG